MGGPRIGSLFSGTGALDLAVLDVFGGQVVWHSQYEPPDKNGKEDKNQYAARILDRHWPGVPNLGDVTQVDWQAVTAEHGPIDILTAGFPCQPFSTAGRRLGYQDERWSPASAPTTAPSVSVKLLPTPTTSNVAGNRTNNRGERLLPGVVSDLLPTPTAADGERTSLTFGRGNPTLTGAITDPPSDAGKPSSDAPPPGPPTLWDD